MSDTESTYPDDGRVRTLSEHARQATIPIIICAATSAVAVSALLSYLAVTNYKDWRRTRGRNRDSLDAPRRFRQQFKNQGYFWLVNLFVADLLQSIGWGLSANSLYTNSLWPGIACNVQGFFINIGDVSSSIWSLIIALHTFLLLAGGQRARAWAAEKSTSGKGRWFFCFGVWAFIFFFAIIGPTLVEKLNPDKGPFYNGAGAGWCWIGKNYFLERIFFHYLYVFIDMVALTVLYVLVFIYIRIQLKRFDSTTAMTTSTGRSHSSRATPDLDRYLDLEAAPVNQFQTHQIMTTKIVSVTTEDRRPSIFSPSIMPSLHSTRTNDSNFARKRMLQVARSLLWYPLIYLCLTAPITIGRLGTYASDDWGQTVIFVGASIYACAGWCNVLLYTATRKGIISWTWCGWKRKVHMPGKRNDTPKPETRLESVSTKHSTSATSTRSSNDVHRPFPEPESEESPPPPAPKDHGRKPSWDIDGVDFTHSTGFDGVSVHEANTVHDRYCIQTRLVENGGNKHGTIICTCKIIPTLRVAVVE